MSENIINVDSQDSQIAKATQDALGTFKFFWRELSWEYRRIVPGLSLAAVKVSFPVKKKWFRKSPETEIMWVNEIYFDGIEIKGKLLNDSQWLNNINSGDTVSLKYTELIDWMYVIDEKVYGAFTVHAIRSKMQEVERNQHDAAWGLNFGDYSNIALAPSVIVSGNKELQYDYTQSIVDTAVLEMSEHAMSVNMRTSIAEQLSSHPDLVNSIDSEGWTLLQREALAGNLSPIEILCKNGADKSLKNPFGETALDLAIKMDWPMIIQFLSQE